MPEYEILKLLPAVLLYVALLGYGVTLCIDSCLCCKGCCSCCICKKPKFIYHLEKALIDVSFDIFFTDNSQENIVQDVMKNIDSKSVQGEEDSESNTSMSWVFKPLLKVSYAVFSTLPIMLIGMTTIVFWDSYILFETNNCLLYVNDTSLECFTNASGHLSCGAILQLDSEWYNCYKLAFDLKTASAAARVILVTTIASNKYLY